MAEGFSPAEETTVSHWDDEIREGELVELARQLVMAASPNPPGDVTRPARILQDVLESEGLEIELIAGDRPDVVNLAARLAFPRPGRTLVLNGHLDVVPAGTGWSVDPFAAEIRDDYIFGRGAVDMKGGLAVIAQAMAALKRSKTSLGGQILFLAAADEETGSIQGTSLLIGRGMAREASFAIVCEPTNLEVKHGNRGLRWLEIHVRGKAAHASRPALGANAIEQAALIVQQLKEMRFQHRNEHFEAPEPTLAVTMIQAGAKINVIPETCIISLDRRMLPGETSESVVSEVQAVLDAVARPGFTAEIKVLPATWEPFVLNESEPVLQAVQQARQMVCGSPSRLKAKSACTDASYFYQAGIPAVLFGPGDSCYAHAPDEKLPVSHLVPAVRVICRAAEILLA